MDGDNDGNDGDDVDSHLVQFSRSFPTPYAYGHYNIKCATDKINRRRGDKRDFQTACSALQ